MADLGAHHIGHRHIEHRVLAGGVEEAPFREIGVIPGTDHRATVADAERHGARGPVRAAQGSGDTAADHEGAQ
jgi:hypothetical protein